MNNIGEIIAISPNNKQKITKINAECSKGDSHIIYKNSILPKSKYNFGVCKNCNNIMHNSCKGKRYCLLCINYKKEQIVCNFPKNCNGIIKRFSLMICYECDKICGYIFHEGVIHPFGGERFIYDNDNVYHYKCVIVNK